VDEVSLNPIIYLRRAQQQGDRWCAEIPALRPNWRSEVGEIEHVVSAARAVASDHKNNLKVKVEAGTSLSRENVLALIGANRGPEGLDLSSCEMQAIDFARGALQGDLRASAEAARVRGGMPKLPALVAHLRFLLGPLRASRAGGSADRPSWLSSLTRGVNLKGAQLQGANLEGAQLQGADLALAQLQGADLALAQLQDAVLVAAQLQGANLEGAQLQGTSLAAAQLQGANLGYTWLQGANLEAAQLRRVDFRYAHLEQVDLSGAVSLEETRWSHTFLDGTRMRRDQLGDSIGDEQDAHGARYRNKTIIYRQVAEAYLQLKTNFSSIGRYDDAAWALVKERQMEKMAHYHGWKPRYSPHRWLRLRALRHRWGRRWFRWGRRWFQWGRHITARWGSHLAWGDFRRWAWSWISELSTGYGEQPWLPPIWGAVIIFVFAFFYVGQVDPNFGQQSTATQQQLTPAANPETASAVATSVSLAIVGPMSTVTARLDQLTALVAVSDQASQGDPTPTAAQPEATVLSAVDVTPKQQHLAVEVAAEGPCPKGGRLAHFGEALTHSVSAFFTIGFNTMEPCNATARGLTITESALGIGLFALFVWTLGNRMRRA
jgi:uncharacterized protein YjbI with pentapeptide repeats